jgi:hypothetical protein
MPWKVIDSHSTTTTIRTGFFLPVRNSDRGSNPWRILEIVVGGVTVSSPDNETKNGNKENKQGCNRTNNHPGRKLVGRGYWRGCGFRTTAMCRQIHTLLFAVFTLVDNIT